MHVLCILSTKGGVGKTTVAANLGGILADAGKRVLLLDLDIQPTLSSYFGLAYEAPGGIYELIALNDCRPEQVVSRTVIPDLDLILSNDDQGKLATLLLHAPDGRVRLCHLLDRFRTDYDLMLIDTQGARSVLLEMAVLASDRVLSPITPEMLAAREFRRGTLRLLDDLRPFQRLGFATPPLSIVLNRADTVSLDARLIMQGLRRTFATDAGIEVLDSVIPSLVAYRQAATLGQPVHRLETCKPKGRRAPAALDTMRDFARELFPQWAAELALVNGQRPSVPVVRELLS